MKYLFVILMLSCAPNREFWTWANDSDDASLLMDAIPSINKEAGCNWLFISGEGNGVAVYSSDEDLKDVGDCTIGYYDEINNEIVLSTNEQDSMKFRVLIHEIGHAVGLDHVPNTIMNKTLEYMTHDDAVKSLVNLAREHHLIHCEKLK